jgi:UDP-N-acetylmuramate dehydrogenase
MKVRENASLRTLNTFGVPARAGLLIEIDNEEDILSAPVYNPDTDLILGGGSNVLLVSDVPGTVFLNRIMGQSIIETDGDEVVLEVAAGENWHDLVQSTLAQGLHGLENLSLIPGLAGAAPIQNIGAYGVELSSSLEFVTAWDWNKATWVNFAADECELEYRDSRFKSREPNRYFITSIGLRLSRIFTPHLGYESLAESLSRSGIENPTARQVSDAVTRLRKDRLPDPASTGNAGSFFKNPVISMVEAELLRERYPGIPVWPAGADRAKLSAGWLIEQCGLKGFEQNGASVSQQHALVLINSGEASGQQILALAKHVASAVSERFGIVLENEPGIRDYSRGKLDVASSRLDFE